MGTMVLDPREHPHAMRPKSLFIFYTGHLRTSVADPHPDLRKKRLGVFLIQLPYSYRTILLHKDINWCVLPLSTELRKISGFLKVFFVQLIVFHGSAQPTLFHNTVYFKSFFDYLNLPRYRVSTYHKITILQQPATSSCPDL